MANDMVTNLRGFHNMWRTFEYIRKYITFVTKKSAPSNSPPSSLFLNGCKKGYQPEITLYRVAMLTCWQIHVVSEEWL